MAIADARQPGEDPAFAHVLATEIRPLLPSLEDHRHAFAGAVWRDTVLLSFAAAVAAAHVGARGAEELVPFVVLAALATGVWLHARRRRIWHAAMIEAVMPAICRFLGVTIPLPATPSALAMFEALGLLGPCRSRIVAHRFKIKRSNTIFTAQRATLGRACVVPGWVTRAFHGLLMEVAVRVRPPTRIMRGRRPRW